MDKIIREKIMLINWHNDKYNCKTYHFPTINSDADSYFIKREPTEYLTEYDFETLPQLNQLLSEMWKKDEYIQEIIKPICIAAMKCKPIDQIHYENNLYDIQEDSKDEKLPEYIYNF